MSETKTPTPTEATKASHSIPVTVAPPVNKPTVITTSKPSTTSAQEAEALKQAKAHVAESNPPEGKDVPPKQKRDLLGEKARVESWLREVKTYLTTFEGRKGFNPHFPLVKEVLPLEKRLAEGEVSEELFDKILNLKKKEPTI